MKTVCTKPAELTRESLKGLKLELDRHDFTEKQLNTAWNEMTNGDIVADIIAFIRQQALGSVLISHETRVKNAFAKLRLNHSFNKMQLDWLARIEKVMLEESVLDEQIFELGAFKNNGGFNGIDRRFGGKLRDIISELNTYLYEDGGHVSVNNQEIVAKLWNLCNVLRDDGITYQQYVTELTYILFLKMCKETGTETAIPEKYRWDALISKTGIELKKFYKELLDHLGENCTGRVREIYAGAQTNIDEPKNLEKIITTIDQFDWYSAKEEGLGNLYEGLLEKNATEKKSGAGQYFTPRVLINVMTRLVAPQAGERCYDPACGTFGFMIAADRFVKDHTDELFDLSVISRSFSGHKRSPAASLSTIPIASP